MIIVNSLNYKFQNLKFEKLKIKQILLNAIYGKRENEEKVECGRYPISSFNF